MAILSNVRGSLSARSAAVAKPAALPPAHRRGVSHADGRRSTVLSPAHRRGVSLADGRRPAALSPARQRGVSLADGRRPARLVAAPAREVARPCGPRPMAGSVGWLMLVGVLGFLLVLGIGWSMGGQPSGAVPDRTVLVQVHQGESLWTVAQRLSPGAPADAVVAKIRQLNDLTADSVLFPGELLRVPSTLTATQR